MVIQAASKAQLQGVLIQRRNLALRNSITPSSWMLRPVGPSGRPRSAQPAPCSTERRALRPLASQARRRHNSTAGARIFGAVRSCLPSKWAKCFLDWNWLARPHWESCCMSADGADRLDDATWDPTIWQDRRLLSLIFALNPHGNRPSAIEDRRAALHLTEDDDTGLGDLTIAIVDDEVVGAP